MEFCVPMGHNGRRKASALLLEVGGKSDGPSQQSNPQQSDPALPQLPSVVPNPLRANALLY